MTQQKPFDVAIVGGGPAGLLAAILVAATGAHTICFAPKPKGRDRRTSALMRGSLDILSDAGILESLLPVSAPLEKIRIIDDTAHVFRGPSVDFDSAEIGGEPFARNFHNKDLVAALLDKAENLENLNLLDDGIVDIQVAENSVSLETVSGLKISAGLVIGADGRMSPCRNAAGIPAKIAKLPQSALVFNVKHSRPHKNISTEFHRNNGPLTLVPLPGNHSSIVWVESHAEARRIKDLDKGAFRELLNEKSYGILGNISDTSPYALFPLSNLSVSEIGKGRIALVGEAAHVVPPIGAQGLNLGFRDAATIAGLIDAAQKSSGDLAALVGDYARLRKRDIATRSGLVNLLNRSLLSEFVPVQFLRSAGLAAMANSVPLRKFAMKAGIGPRV